MFEWPLNHPKRKGSYKINTIVFPKKKNYFKKYLKKSRFSIQEILLSGDGQMEAKFFLLFNTLELKLDSNLILITKYLKNST